MKLPDERLEAPRLKGSRQQGFFLIEVQVAAVVLALGIALLAQLHPDILFTSSQSRARTDAIALAETKLEQFRGYMYRSEYNGISSSLSADFITAVTGDGRSANYRRSWTVVPQVAPDNKLVNIRVEWTDSRNEVQAVELSTRIYGVEPAKSGKHFLKS